MAVTVGITTDKPQYIKGELVTATITVDGEEPGGQKQIKVSAVVEVGGTEYSVETPLTVTWPAAPVKVLGVTAPGMLFEPKAGSDDLVWTAVAA